MRKAILFDLDGTLWDSSQEVATAWTQALAPYGVTLTRADIQSIMGKTMTEIGDALLSAHPPQERPRLLELASDAEIAYLRAHGATLYPGLEATLKTLSQTYFLAIVSNCQEGYIEAFLDYYGFGRYFSDTENFGRTGRPKGENIRLVAERNHLGPVLYLGDTQKDCDAAALAGVPFVHAAYGFGTIDHPVPRLDRLADLPALAAQLL